MHIPLVNGRMFDHAGLMRGAHVALVNQAFVKQYLWEMGTQSASTFAVPCLKSHSPICFLTEATDGWMEDDRSGGRCS